MPLNIKTTLGILGLLLFPFIIHSQTIIINPANATGTSGADGSFQNATNTFPANNWTVVNGTAANKWFVGTQSSCAGTKGAYVGTAAGNNTYTATTSAISHFYKDVTFPAGQSCITLSFNWKGQGESGYDGIRIFLGSTTAAPVANTAFNSTDPSATQLGNDFYCLQAACGTATVTIPPSFAGTTKRLVFSWQNDGIDGTTPAGTLDAISLTAQAPVIPGCATALSPANAATNVTTCNGLSWTAPAVTTCNAADSYDVYFGTTPTPPFVINTTATSYAPVMNYSTTYYWQIRPKNSTGAAVCAVQSFTTGTSTNPQFNLVDNATSAAPYNCVTLTPNAASQRGCAWDANSTLNFLANFSYEIDINLGSDDAGADGMSFVVHNDPLGRCKCGAVGGALGAGGISNSVTIELDTYINYEDRDDFVSPTLGCTSLEEPDHLDVWFNGVINPDLDFNCDAVAAGERVATPNAVRLQSAPGVNYNIENGLGHKLRIAWNAGTNTLTASVLNAALTVTYGTISTTFNPMTIFGTNTPYFGFTGSTGGLSNQQTFCLPSVLLPVEISSFEASCANKQSVIEWETETERDNDFFTLERSCNGTTFTPLAVITGAGTTTIAHSYKFTDPDQCAGINYYRLSQTDMNGELHHLGVRSIASCLETSDILIYPNPAADQLTITWHEKHITHVTLFNSVGQHVMEQDEDPELHTATAQIDVSLLAPGIYYITIYTESGSETVKVMVE